MSNRSFCTTVGDCGPAVACVNGKCICNEYWSTNMDFLDYQTCATNEIAMYVLWALNVALIAFVLYKSAWIIVLRFENFFEQRRLKRNYTLFQNKGLIAVIIEFGISMPAQLAMAILHFVNPTTRIGFALAPTVLFFVSKLGFYACVIFVQGPMLAVALKGDANKKNIVRFGYISNTISSVLAIINAALPFITYTNYQSVDQEENQLSVLRAYFFIQTCTMAINAMLSMLIIRKVNEVFDLAQNLVSSQENKNASIRKKVNNLQKETIRQATVQGTLYLLMGAIPILNLGHAWFLPISWLAMPLLGMKLAHQVNLDKKGMKTIMQRLGIVKTSTFGEPDKREGGSSMIENTYTNNKQVTTLSPLASTAGRFKAASSAVSETTQMEELLDPAHPSHKAFIEFVKARYAHSELELLELLLGYRRAKSLKDRKKIGNTIMKRFIVDGAPQQVDIPDGVRKILMSTAAKGMFNEGTFDSIRGPLVFEIKGNFFAPFEKKMSLNTFSEENI